MTIIRKGEKMDDLISRAKTIEVLKRLPGIGHKALNAIRELPEEQDAEAYQRGYEDGFREGRTRKELIALGGIDMLPSAQPEIVRCEDCKYYEADITANPWGVCCHKSWIVNDVGQDVDENGWCYRAERRPQ